MLKEKTKAPDFTLSDKDGNKVSLSDFLGKRIIFFSVLFIRAPPSAENTSFSAATATVFKELQLKKALSAISVTEAGI